MVEEVMLVLQRLLDADELDAVRQVDVHGHDVYVKLDEPRQPCRQCKRTAEEIQHATRGFRAWRTRTSNCAGEVSLPRASRAPLFPHGQ